MDTILQDKIKVSKAGGPRPIIWDTDWWTDVDDVVAARVLVWAERQGLIEIVGLVLDACMADSVASLDAFFTGEGRGGLPIAIDHGATDFGGAPKYQARLTTAPHNYKSNADAEAARDFYRRALATAKSKVDLICVGFGNALAALLGSEADRISPLSGLELIRQKVNHLWWMAGKWPSGSENNIARNLRSRRSAYCLVDRWPTPITFLGYEVGVDVITGGILQEFSPDDLLAKAMADHGSAKGRSSWDPMLTLMACLGNPALSGYDVVVGTASVDPATGVNSFTCDPAGKHRYVTKLYSDSWYEKMIDHILDRRIWN